MALLALPGAGRALCTRVQRSVQASVVSRPAEHSGSVLALAGTLAPWLCLTLCHVSPALPQLAVPPGICPRSSWSPGWRENYLPRLVLWLKYWQVSEHTRVTGRSALWPGPERGLQTLARG